MFWVDEVISEIERRWPKRNNFIVRDEKTPSGRVHVGSLRGVVIHGVVAAALAEKGHDVKYYYEINDADPMDGLPVYLPKEKFLPHMGKPLKDVPSPESPDTPPTSEKNYAQYFGDEFVSVIRRLGFTPEIYLNSAVYAAGKYDHLIDLTLERADLIRSIYKEVSGSVKREEWNPVQVVCEKCGRVGTTTVVGYEGERGKRIVQYECEPNKVKWAVGCGHKGNVAPYRGRGKLPWKVEWAAKWALFPVDIEGAGKDHSVSGGSRDVAARICREVFEAEVPVNVPYEFFTLAGAKMSSSKGRGASAVEVADMLPEELLRFLMVRNRPERHIDFEPGGGTMTRLYDFFDESVDISFGRKASDVTEDIKKALHYSVIDSRHEADFFRPRFSRCAFLVQMPQLDFLEEVEKLKGAKLTNEEKEEAKRRADYARRWLNDYAPENDKFEVRKELPEAAKSLTEDQRKFLRDVADLIRRRLPTACLPARQGQAGTVAPRSEREAGLVGPASSDAEPKNKQGEELHSALHELRKKSPLQPKEAFQAIYLALLGKDSGPQAGWFLKALPKKFVVKRFTEI